MGHPEFSYILPYHLPKNLGHGHAVESWVTAVPLACSSQKWRRHPFLRLDYRWIYSYTSQHQPTCFRTLKLHQLKTTPACWGWIRSAPARDGRLYPPAWIFEASCLSDPLIPKRARMPGPTCLPVLTGFELFLKRSHCYWVSNRRWIISVCPSVPRMITKDFQILATQTDKNINLRSQHLALACSCPLYNSHQPYQGLPALFRSPGVQEVKKVFQSLNLCSCQNWPYLKEIEKRYLTMSVQSMPLKSRPRGVER